MMVGTVILNEREAREARTIAAELEAALSSESIFGSIVAGLPPQIADGFRKSLKGQKAELEALVQAYDAAKDGNHSTLKKRAGNDPGLCLIVARIARGLTQKELARKLGLKEQQIQRYEADRYRTISIANFQRIASVLGVQWEISLSKWIGSGWDVAHDVTATEVKKIIKHARISGWFDDDASPADTSDEASFSYLQRYVSDQIVKYGSPSLLRTGLNVDDHSEDLLLLAWKARVTRRAEKVIESGIPEYRSLDISWLIELVRLSEAENGPLLAQRFLLSKGIILVVESQIPSMRVDGAAFLVGSTPVIGMTIRRDTIDNFWFTLMHEVGHVILHYRSGLTVGFFDDSDASSLDEIEAEANDFASNILIPDEKWKRSPARIAKSVTVVEKFAKELKIHPAIVFGRMQKERGNYATFSSLIGRGQVKKFLVP